MPDLCLLFFAVVALVSLLWKAIRESSQPSGERASPYNFLQHHETVVAMREALDRIRIIHGAEARPLTRKKLPADWPKKLKGRDAKETRRVRKYVYASDVGSELYRAFVKSQKDAVLRNALSDFLRDAGFDGAADNLLKQAGGPSPERLPPPE
jgi:hypothetical protein